MVNISDLPTPGSRLDFFIKTDPRYKGNRSKFGRDAGGIRSDMLGSYCADEKDPTLETIIGMAATGLNIMWYLLNIGEMYFNPESDTEQGKQQRAALVKEATEAYKQLGDILERLTVLA